MWQPIESAPKDGRKVLLYLKPKGVEWDWPYIVAQWDDALGDTGAWEAPLSDGFMREVEEEFDTPAIMWMPIPNPSER